MLQSLYKEGQPEDQKAGSQIGIQPPSGHHNMPWAYGQKKKAPEGQTLVLEKTFDQTVDRIQSKDGHRRLRKSAQEGGEVSAVQCKKGH